MGDKVKRDKSKWATLCCQVTPAFAAECKAASGALGFKNVSGLVREAIEVYLKANKQNMQSAPSWTPEVQS